MKPYSISCTSTEAQYCLVSKTVSKTIEEIRAETKLRVEEKILSAKKALTVYVEEVAIINSDIAKVEKMLLSLKIRAAAL